MGCCWTQPSRAVLNLKFALAVLYRRPSGMWGVCSPTQLRWKYCFVNHASDDGMSSSAHFQLTILKHELAWQNEEILDIADVRWQNCVSKYSWQKFSNINLARHAWNMHQLNAQWWEGTKWQVLRGITRRLIEDVKNSEKLEEDVTQKSDTKWENVTMNWQKN